MKLNEHSKKRLTIAGCVVICCVLAVAIGSQFRGSSVASQTAAESSTANESVQVNPERMETTVETTIKEERTTEVVVTTQQPTEEITEKEETPAAALPVQTDKTEQAIQPAPEKPSAPPEDVIQNPTQKPNGEAVEGTPEAIPHEEVVQPSVSPTAAGEPQAGDTQNGQIYIPGFGWVDNEGGGGSGTTANDMYENGNKIGIMD